MNPIRFDQITKLFAQRRMSRRQAVQGAAGLAAASLGATGMKAVAAQDGTPAASASPTPGSAPAKTEFLFVQSFESGAIAPTEGADATFTLTLQHGLGQTLYFSDRPERIVGATPTAQFLAGLGFSPDNPPNAALVVSAGDGSTDIAVVELTNPTYDETSSTATYDVTVLENYVDSVDMQFQEASSDLAAVAASFGSAHLFIDDCTSAYIDCYLNDSEEEYAGQAGRANTCWDPGRNGCAFCDEAAATQQCNTNVGDCRNICYAAVNPFG